MNITKRGKYWQYRFDGATVNGKRQQISKSGFRTKKEAQDAGYKAQAEYNQSGIAFNPMEISVSDYLDYWFKEYVETNLRPNTQYGYKGIIENHLKPEFGNYRLSSLTTASIQPYLNKLGNNGYSKSMVTGIISVLSASLDYAVYPLQFIRSNPCTYLRKVSEDKMKEKRERIVLSDDEFQSIVNLFPEGNRYNVMLMIGWYCGLRIGETCGLTWDDIDLVNCRLRVDRQMIKKSVTDSISFSLKRKGKKEPLTAWHFAPPKTKTSYRTVTFGEKLRDILAKELESQIRNEETLGEFYTIHVLKGDRVIPVYKGLDVKLPRVRLVCVDIDGQYTSPDSFKYPSRIIHTSLKMPFDYHSLRHTHATKLIEAGVSPKVVQKRLGHTNIETTLNTYVHSTDEMENDAVRRFDDCTHIENLCTECVQNDEIGEQTELHLLIS